MNAIEWTWLILAGICALVAVAAWRAYRRARVPDEEIAPLMVAVLGCAAAFVCLIAWLIALAL